MSIAKEEILSTCEKTFIRSAIEQGIRLDGRRFDEHRPLQIKYGMEWGSCMVSLGETKVLAHVSCEIQQPKSSRPHEGILYLNVDLSNMGSLYFESGRQSDLAVQIVRILEKCLKESRCIDLESLCIVSDEKVWKVRVDISVLNFEGNLMGCCSIAALSALKHFKYPEVTVKDGIITVHSINERNPLSLTVRHFPIVMNYALFRNTDAVMEDPTLTEEKVADTLLLLFLNSYDEFCGMHLEGAPIPHSNVIVQCTKSGCKRAKKIVDLISNAIETDLKERKEDTFNGLVKTIMSNPAFARSQSFQNRATSDKIKKRTQNGAKLQKPFKNENSEDSSDDNMNGSSANEYNIPLPVPITSIKQENTVVQMIAENTAELIAIDSEESAESDTSNDVEVIDAVDKSVNIELSEDSEEDELIVLNSELLQ